MSELHAAADTKETNLEHDRDSFIVTPWPLPCPHFEHNTAHAPNVNFRVIAFFLEMNDFRRHPEDRALHCRRRHSIQVVCAFRNPEIRNLADTRLLHQDVVRLQVLGEE